MLQSTFTLLLATARRNINTAASVKTTSKHYKLPSNVDTQIVNKFPELLKVFSGNIQPRELPTYELRVCIFFFLI